MSCQNVPPKQPVRFSLTQLDLGWLVGLLEGEGTFMLWTRTHIRFGSYRYPLVKLSMTDEDVIHRLHAVTGIGQVYRQHPPSRAQHQANFTWNVVRQHEATALMKLVLPYMGKRRAARIRQILSECSTRSD